MKRLESKLIKNGLLSQFNECLKQFIDTGVVSPVSAFPEMETMQKSFIPLCYSLANNEQATTKLRICTNSISKPKQRLLHSTNAAFLALIILTVLTLFLPEGDLWQRLPIPTSAGAITELAQVRWILASAGCG